MRHLKICAVLLAGITFLSVHGDDKAAQDAFSSGLSLEKERRFLQAADQYKEAEVQADDPVRKANALIAAARVFRKAKRYGSEFDCLQSLAEGHVTRINFAEVVKRQFEIGDKFFAGHRDRFVSWIPFIHKDDRTIEIYEKALKNAPCSPSAAEARLRLGRLYLDDDKPDKAIHHFADAIKLNPESEEARYAALELANTLKVQSSRGDGDSQNAQKALEAFDSFLEKHPNDPKAEWIKRSREEVHNYIAERLCNIGKFYMKAKKYNVAQRYFAAIIQDYPKTKSAETAEAMLAEISKDYQNRGLVWTPDKRPFAESEFPREDMPVIHSPEPKGKWLLPIRDVKGGAVDRTAQEEVVTDDML